MPIFDVADVSDTIVLHFGGESARINAYTLAAAISGIADAAKAANAIVNPGFEIEVVVEALGSGSFRAMLRAITRESRNLFSAASVRNIVLSIVATALYEKVLVPKPSISVNVGATEVVITSGDQKVVVPRTVYDETKRVQDSPTFQNALTKTVSVVASDSAVTTFGIGTDPRRPPPVELPREDFVALPADFGLVDPPTRLLEEITEVQIIRAILERTKRKWEFVWNGSRISAPVLDTEFYDDFFAHRITIAPGDSLLVKMRIKQNRHPDIGIFITESYEIIEVVKHVPREGEQTLMALRPGA